MNFSRPFHRVAGITLTILLLLASSLLRAQPVLPDIDRRYDIRMPVNLNQVEFYLVTVDVGNHVWDNFGHTALRMVDKRNGTDMMFNWGLFDTSIGVVRFAANFARGIMDYQLGVASPEREYGRYQAEARTVWEDRLVLSNLQKRRLYQRLAWNMRPENVVYQYDYFFDNCTTRVRDYLDEALGGRLSENTQVLSQRTFRDEVFEHYASLPLIAFSLDVMMNGRIDRRMTQWEHMFLPLQLRQQLLDMGLLADSQTIMRFTPPSAGPNPYWIAAALLIPLLLLVLSLRKASIAAFSSQPGFTLRLPGLSYRLLGLLGFIISLCSGVYGVIMSLGWWISSHQDLHGNVNLLLFWPTDLLGLGIALRWLWKGRAVTLSGARHQFIVSYLVLHLLAGITYLCIGLLKLSAQNIWPLLWSVLPVLLLYALLVSVAGMQSNRRLRFG